MKQSIYLLVVLVLLLGVTTVDARNTIKQVPIADALEWGEEEGVLVDSVKLFFGDQAHPAVDRNLGTYTANRKTNGVGKSDKKACMWAFLSAIKTLQERAVREGGNAVVNIKSYYYKNDFSSETEFECGAGNIMAGVTMVGDVVKLAE